MNAAFRASEDRQAMRRSQQVARTCGVLGLRDQAWSEEVVLTLRREEAADFERKSGKLLEDRDHALRSLAKALSAFANSGGGLIVLGLEDDGSPAGVLSHVGRTPVKEWLEQKIPRLLDFPLAAFTVTTVQKKVSGSQVPDGRELIVIKVGDSHLAPHQSTKDKIYYHRASGHSVPAAHFYIELLRNRLTSPDLTFTLDNVEEAEHWNNPSGTFGLMKLTFRISNRGRVAAYKWALQPRYYSNEMVTQDELSELLFVNGQIPGNRGASTSVRLEPTILPGCEMLDVHRIAVKIPADVNRSEVIKLVRRLLSGLTVTFQLATETSPGEAVGVRLDSTHIDAFVSFMQARYPQVFDVVV